MFNIEKDLGFIILCPEFKFGGLKTTVSTIKSNFSDPKFLCIVPGNSDEDDVKTAANICPVVKGGNTISSMINIGLKKGKRDWNLVVMSGNIIKYNPLLKYTYFTKAKTDVLYRVMDKNSWKWEEASIHGLLIHKEALKEVGSFPEEENFQLCKLLWGDKAIKKGYTFKGLVGVKTL